MAEGFQGLDQALRRIGQLATDTRHVERPLKAIGVYLVGSVRRTILAGGRPKPFEPLAASTIAARRKGKGKGGAKPLINMGHLLASIDSKVVASGAGGAGVEVGTNYGEKGQVAATLHFGGRKTYTIVPRNKKALAFGSTGADESGAVFSGGRIRLVREGKILVRKVIHPPLPARAFMVLQIPEDEIKAAEIIEHHLARK